MKTSNGMTSSRKYSRMLNVSCWSGHLIQRSIHSTIAPIHKCNFVESMRQWTIDKVTWKSLDVSTATSEACICAQNIHSTEHSLAQTFSTSPESSVFAENLLLVYSGRNAGTSVHRFNCYRSVSRLDFVYAPEDVGRMLGGFMQKYVTQVLSECRHDPSHGIRKPSRTRTDTCAQTSK